MSTVLDQLTTALADRCHLEPELGQGGPQMTGHGGDPRVAAPPSVPILG